MYIYELYTSRYYFLINETKNNNHFHQWKFCSNNRNFRTKITPRLPIKYSKIPRKVSIYEPSFFQRIYIFLRVWRKDYLWKQYEKQVLIELFRFQRYLTQFCKNFTTTLCTTETFHQKVSKVLRCVFCESSPKEKTIKTFRIFVYVLLLLVSKKDSYECGSTVSTFHYFWLIA